MRRNYFEKKLGFGRYFLAGLLLSALPFAAMYVQSKRVVSGTLLRLPVTMERVENRAFTPQIKLNTPLATIDTNIVAGDNNFTDGGQVFVFLSPGPNAIWYPYAVSHRAPRQSCKEMDCLVLSGRVENVAQGQLTIGYQFENYVPGADMLARIPDFNKGGRGELSLSVSADGSATVRALHLGGETITQPIIPLTLDGLIHSGASKAPAANPPT